MSKWRPQLYGSGSVSVSNGSGLFLYVLPPRTPSASQEMRYRIAEALADFLNGADRADCLTVLFRESAEKVILQNGYSITAILMTDLSGQGEWVHDQTVDADIDRGLLIDRIAEQS